MKYFPRFMRKPVNKIEAESQYTPGIEGFVFDGADGSQMAVWTTRDGGKSAEHTHAFDEYMVVVRGKYTLTINNKRVLLGVGKEYFIAKGVAHSGESVLGTRTIHAFGGKRAQRVKR